MSAQFPRQLVSLVTIYHEKSKPALILLIDNYDSFVHNLARYLGQMGCEVAVARNDRISIAQIRDARPQAIVMSPGPGTPDDAGVCVELVKQFTEDIPLLGVCLGHQAICQALGGATIREQPVHGRPCRIDHKGHPLFTGIPNGFRAARYHSLVTCPKRLPDCLEVIATTHSHSNTVENSTPGSPPLIMAVAHRTRPTVGVQFHPESVLTQFGQPLLFNFLRLAGLNPIGPVAEMADGILLEKRSAETADTSPVPEANAGVRVATRPHQYQ